MSPSLQDATTGLGRFAQAARGARGATPGMGKSRKKPDSRRMAAGAMMRRMKTTRCTLRAEETTQEGVRRIAHALIDAALRRGPQANRDPVEIVHFFRTTTKRLRALLRLIQPVIARTAFERENARLKRIADRLAPFRDRTVMIETLNALGQPASLLRQGSRTGGTEQKAASGKRARALSQAARELEQARAGWRKLRIRGAGWEVIGPGLTRVYRQARRRMKTAVASQDDRAFHRWRIRVKQLCYQLQWLEAIWPRRLARMVRRLHQLEDRLGRDHDLVVLRALLEQAPAISGDHAVVRKAVKAAAHRSRRWRRAAGQLGAKALSETPRRFLRSCERHWRSWEKRQRGECVGPRQQKARFTGRAPLCDAPIFQTRPRSKRRSRRR